MQQVNKSSGRTAAGRRAKNGGTDTRRLGLKHLFLGAGIVLALAMVFYTINATNATAPVREWARARLVTLAANMGYRVRNLYVVGRQYTDADVMRGIVNVHRGDPLFDFDPDTARDLLMKISWVKDAVVRRQLPDTIYVQLTERQPMALWQQGGKVRVIDRDGIPLTTDLRGFNALPLVVGDGANTQAATLIDLIQAEGTLANRVENALWVGSRRWDLMFTGGMIVKLPEDDLGLAIKRLADAQTSEKILDKDLLVIDLREPDRVVVRARPGATPATPEPAGFKKGEKSL